MLSSELIDKAGAVHTIVPAGHRIGTPQVAGPAALHAACWQHMLGQCSTGLRQNLCGEVKSCADTSPLWSPSVHCSGVQHFDEPLGVMCRCCSGQFPRRRRRP